MHGVITFGLVGVVTAVIVSDLALFARLNLLWEVHVKISNPLLMLTRV